MAGVGIGAESRRQRAVLAVVAVFTFFATRWVLQWRTPGSSVHHGPATSGGILNLLRESGSPLDGVSDPQAIEAIEAEIRHHIETSKHLEGAIPADGGLRTEIGMMVTNDCVPVFIVDETQEVVAFIERGDDRRLFEMLDKLRSLFASRIAASHRQPEYLQVAGRAHGHPGVKITLSQPWPGVPAILYQYDLSPTAPEPLVLVRDQAWTMHVNPDTGVRENSGWSFLDAVGAEPPSPNYSLGFGADDIVMEFRTADLATCLVPYRK